MKIDVDMKEVREIVENSPNKNDYVDTYYARIGGIDYKDVGLMLLNRSAPIFAEYKIDRILKEIPKGIRP